MLVYKLDMHDLLPYRHKPAHMLFPYSNGFNLEIKLDYPNNQLIIIDPYTNVTIEKIRNGGLPFFNCPKCDIRVQHIFIDTRDDEVCCKYCMSLKEIDMDA